MRRVVLILCVVLLASTAQGIVLQISVNGDPDPVDSEIIVAPSEEIILDIHSPSGHSGGGEDDVYFILKVDATLGSLSGGVVVPGAPSCSSIAPCDEVCPFVLGPQEIGLWGAIVSCSGTPTPPGVYIDEIIYHLEWQPNDTVIQLYTTQDFVELTLQDTVIVHSNGHAMDCLKSSAPEYDRWVGYGKPDCWCYRKQCRCDIDGVMTGPFPVGIPDLTIFKATFNQVVLPPGGECADLDHGNTGPFPVGIPDLALCKLYFSEIDSQVPQCDEPPVYTGPYNWWTN